MDTRMILEGGRITVPRILRNASPASLYEEALRNEPHSAIASSGALIVSSGAKTGRSPKDKRIVNHPSYQSDINWGDVNIPLTDHTFMINYERAVDYLNTCQTLFVVDGFAGWDTSNRLRIRVICSRAYHALFMRNMLIRPTEKEMAEFKEPDFTILNAGKFPANRYTAEMTSTTSIDLDFERKKLVILGTEYAGEMKKGVFTVMHYLMPKKNILSMHCSANVGKQGDVSLLFGLSGTGKTTLSADPQRELIGDDEHCWSGNGVFNIEGGCYAKCIQLSEEKEPDIFKAIRFGTVLENVAYDAESREVDFDDSGLTENTRASYPIEYISDAKIPCVAGHPKNIIFLTCDAFGVLPPVARLSTEQAMYHFMSGYTAKVAGTEMGVSEPQATFSACFGAAFLVWHPNKYAELLRQHIKTHNSKVWLVNTGWSGGGHGVGYRMPIAASRAIINAIHSGELNSVKWVKEPFFNLEVPESCPQVDSKLLNPKNTWKDAAAYDAQAAKLCNLFVENFKKYEKFVEKEVVSAGPKSIEKGGAQRQQDNRREATPSR